MAQRKLQQEIDKVIKKVKEGTAEFDYLYDKLINTENSSQKEKLEGDLKKEIKKLQRSRDQIKTWMSGNEVKDKSQLLEMRKEIELDMEKFKDVEKEMKTKAFSKQGLNMQQKLDPREREKVEMGNFLQSMIEELVLQIEALEARIDALSSSKRKLTSKKQEELKDNQERLDRNNYHQSQLETILRLLENGDLDTDDINEMKEDIEFYVGHNHEDLFFDDDAMYEQLGLETKDEYFANLNNNDDETVESSPAPAERPQTPSPSPPPTAAPVSAPVSAPAPVVATAAPATAPATAPKRVVSASSIKPATPTPAPTPAKVVPAPKVKYSAIIAANQAQAAQAQAQAQAAAQALAASQAAAAQAQQPPPILTSLTRVTTNTTVSSMTRESTQSPKAEPVEPVSINESLMKLSSSLMESIQNVSKPLPFENISNLLKNSLLTCPDSFDCDKRKNYHSDFPTRTFVYYPQEPLIALINNTKNLKMYDESTLFYIYYHHASIPNSVEYHTDYGKYLQYSAGKELNSRGWLYNVDEQIWYHADGTVVREDSFKYFDYKNEWAERHIDNVNKELLVPIV